MHREFDFELAKAANSLVREMAKVKAGDNVLIYADSESDWRVVEETAKAVHNIGGKVAVMWYPAPKGVGEAADQYIPSSLEAAMLSCDIMIEFSKRYLLYSTPWRKAMETKRIRYLCLSGMTADMMVRCIGRVDLWKLAEFQEILAELTRNARKMRVITQAGTDITFENDPSRPIFCEGIVKDQPGEYMLIGQVDWAPIEGSINGRIVFDGSVWPPEDLGLLKDRITLEVENGRVIKIDGYWEAKRFERWLRELDDPAMFNVVHISYGCNPGAKLTGFILEDERVWGCTQWGLGYQAESFRGRAGPAKSHTDGICLNSSVLGDGEEIAREGEFTHPRLAKLARTLRLT